MAIFHITANTKYPGTRRMISGGLIRVTRRIPPYCTQHNLGKGVSSVAYYIPHLYDQWWMHLMSAWWVCFGWLPMCYQLSNPSQYSDHMLPIMGTVDKHWKGRHTQSIIKRSHSTKQWLAVCEIHLYFVNFEKKVNLLPIIPCVFWRETFCVLS